MAEYQVTSIVRAKVQTDNFEAYRKATEHIIDVCCEFDGYLGTRIIEPENPDSERVTIFSFDRYENFLQWEKSKERLICIQKLDALVDSPIHREKISGLNYWMQPELIENKWAPSWRMTAIAFLAIFPLSYFIPPLIHPLFPHHPFIGAVVAIGIVTILMSNVSLPLMAKLFKKLIN